MYSVAFARSASDLDAALWEACFPPPLEGRWWYQTLERSRLEDQFTFLYGVISRKGTAVGIAPAFVMNFPVSLVAPDALKPLVPFLGALAHPKTLFVGSPCADEGTVGLLPDADRAAALLALHDALLTKAAELDAPLIVWKDQRSGTPQPAGTFSVVSFPGTLVELGADRAAYLASLKGSRRHNVVKKIRRSHANASLRAEVLQQPPLDEVFPLFWQTYERSSTRFEKLNREFFARIAEVPCTRFIVLREATGAMVAFMMCFELGTKLINKFVGMDYRRPGEWQLHFRLWEATLDYAYSRGIRQIQSGQTGYAAKIETGHRLVPLVNFCRHRNRLIHALAARAARGIGWATLDDDLARHVRAHPESEAEARAGSQNGREAQ
jgi:hypothetical protein